jgi:hypothetical protein
MLLDALTMVSNAQAITGPATTLATNVIDFSLGGPSIGQALQREPGSGEPIGFGVDVVAGAFATSGDETYSFQVIQSATANMAAPDVIAQRAFSAPQVTAGALVAGTKFFIEIPPGWPTKEFLSLQVVTGGTTPAITLTAWLTACSNFSVEAAIYPKDAIY